MVIPGYTEEVKTAISLPDATFERATKRAAVLGMSRSELFVRAVDRYLDELDDDTVIAQIDAALPDTAEGSVVDAADAGRRRLAALDDEW